ncbi:MAG: hypothetical protein M0P73_10090 [Syntrophobacterales bacterium]|nr:hypothetical protein [Syntrophobacterales bacterium]
MAKLIRCFLSSRAAREDPVEAPFARLILTVMVMHLLGTVEAQSHQKIMLPQELAPGLIQERAVGLEVIFTADMERAVTLLQLHDPVMVMRT